MEVVAVNPAIFPGRIPLFDGLGDALAVEVQLYSRALSIVKDLTGVQNLSGLCSTLMNNALAVSAGAQAVSKSVGTGSHAGGFQARKKAGLAQRRKKKHTS